MPRKENSRVVQPINDNDIHNGNAFSVSTREKLTPYLTIPAQSAIYIQGKTQDVEIMMFERGYDLINDVGNAGIDVEISLYQNCTSDTEDSNVLTFNLSNENHQGSLLINTSPQNFTLGDYRGDLSSNVKTTNKAVSLSANIESEYIMPLNDKSIIVIENFTLENLGIAFYWKYIER